MGRSLFLFPIFLTLFTSCYKDRLYVQQEWVDRSFLASSHVGTPDPRQADPPLGQRLLVAWRFPKYLIDQQLKLNLTVRFWDNSERIYTHVMEKSRSYEAFNFFGQKILTYQIQVIDSENQVVETWEHHFWTQLIDTDRSRVSVSSQPIQGSVIDTP